MLVKSKETAIEVALRRLGYGDLYDDPNSFRLRTQKAITEAVQAANGGRMPTSMLIDQSFLSVDWDTTQNECRDAAIQLVMDVLDNDEQILSLFYEESAASKTLEIANSMLGAAVRRALDHTLGDVVACMANGMSCKVRLRT
jgi:hypothetical protein